MKTQIKNTIKSELIELGILEEGQYLDENSSFIELGVEAPELESIILEIEEKLGVMFDEDIFVENTIRDVLGTTYS